MADVTDATSQQSLSPLPGEIWGSALRQVSPPLPLMLLALRTFGVSETVLGAAFQLSEAQMRVLLQVGLEQGRERNLRPGLRYEGKLEPIGLAELARLIATASTPCETEELQFQEEETIVLKQISKGEKMTYVDDDLPHRRLLLSESAKSWLAQIRRLFLQPEGQIDLILLLPRSDLSDQIGHWQRIRWGDGTASDEKALRLLAGLSVLGLTHSAFLGDLVIGAQMLFEHFAVCGAAKKDRPDDENTCRKMRFLASDVLLQRPSPDTKQTKHNIACPLVLDFSSAWADQDYRFADYSVRDRGGDADEIADALLWLMAKTSGICLQVTLAPRPGKTKKHDVRILAPKSWIDFFRQGLGAKRRSGEVFAPYQGKEENVPLLWVDEPPRYEALKGDNKRAYRKRQVR